MSPRRVELIGKPLNRPHSKVMHDAAFDAAGIDARFELRELDRDELPEFVAAARDDEWLGFQVTAPYKQDVLGLLDDVDEQAREIGAVNSVVRELDGRLLGFNTDAPGYARAVASELGLSFAGAAVAVAGAGGAARAVCRAAIDGGAAQVHLAARDRAAAERLADSLAGPIVPHGLGEGAFEAALGEVRLLTNATTVGMLSPGPVVDVALLAESCAVFDLVYVPAETELLAAARARRLPAANGAGMLVHQAATAFERWTGVDDAAPTMRRAVEPLLTRDGPA